IHWPIEWQTYLLKHSAVIPAVTIAAPETGMRNIVRRLPIPRGVCPERLVLVPSGLHELQPLAIADLVFIDGERVDGLGMQVKLIVPTELRAIQAQGDDAAWDLNRFWK